MASIKKVTERKYRVQVFNGYLPNGKKICKSYTVDVPASIHNAETYVAARAYELESNFRHGSHINDKTTLSEYAESWARRQTNYKPATLESYKTALRYICKDIGGIKLSDLRPIVIEEEIRILRSRRHGGEKIQDITVEKYITVLSVVLEDAVRNRLMPENPIRWVKRPIPVKKEQHIPTEDEMNRFVSALDEEPLVYKIYYLMALHTGARRGELCALRWGDIRNGVMSVSKSRVYIPSVGIIEGSTKNRKTRVVPVPQKVQEQVDELRERQRKGLSWCRRHGEIVRKLKCEDDGYIFVDDEGNPLSPDSFTKRIRIVIRQNDLPEAFHLHTLRHYYASYLMNNGVGSKIVADILGHADSGFLERTYGHAMPEISEKVIRALEGMGRKSNTDDDKPGAD